MSRNEFFSFLGTKHIIFIFAAFVFPVQTLSGPQRVDIKGEGKQHTLEIDLPFQGLVSGLNSLCLHPLGLC